MFYRRLAVCVVLALLALTPLLVALAFSAHATPTYHATLRCAHIAEDSAAHVRLVTYAPHANGSVHIVYACKRHGY
jgi:hypothetical protein